MQFPNGVNKSNLIKLGMLGAAMYFMNNRNKSQAQIQNKQTNNTQSEQRDTDSTNNNTNQTMSPFQMGKALADRVLGRKS